MQGNINLPGCVYTPIILGKCSQAEFTVPEVHGYSGQATFGHFLDGILTQHRFKSKSTRFGGVTQVKKKK